MRNINEDTRDTTTQAGVASGAACRDNRPRFVMTCEYGSGLLQLDSSGGTEGNAGRGQDALLQVLQQGAQKLLRQTLEAEADAFVDRHRGLTDEQGLHRIVRNGYSIARKISTCLGPMEVSVPRVRDRAGAMRFTSGILLPYQRRTESSRELFAGLYLRSMCIGDYREALAALLGRGVVCLPAEATFRLKRAWQEEHNRWSGRNLADRGYAALWADAVQFQQQPDANSKCLLVAIGVYANGTFDVAAVQEGSPDSQRSWLQLRGELHARGFEQKQGMTMSGLGAKFWDGLGQLRDGAELFALVER